MCIYEYTHVQESRNITISYEYNDYNPTLLYDTEYIVYSYTRYIYSICRGHRGTTVLKYTLYRSTKHINVEYTCGEKRDQRQVFVAIVINVYRVIFNLCYRNFLTLYTA